MRLETFAYVSCPQCKKEWSKLRDNGLCIECDQKKYEEILHKKRMEDKFKRIFGSIKTMNYYTFERFMKTDGNEEAFDACREFEPTRHNLYLWGSVGTGKSHLGYATAKMVALHGGEVIVTTPLRMVDVFRTKTDAEKETRFEEFTECDLLLIDDLGISKYTDFGLEVLCEILNRRTLQLRNGLIVTSNLSINHLAKRNNDDRLASRLTGLCRVLSLSGEDFRVKR